jgi:hypothetical protein
MKEEQRRILDMLAQGKINVAEAEQLLDALARGNGAGTTSPSSTQNPPKYLRVLVVDENEHGGKVNVRVPLNLIRAGVRLAALLPHGVYDQVNKALKENGMDFDVSQIKPENLEDLVQHLSELSVDVEGNRGETVRVFCE